MTNCKIQKSREINRGGDCWAAARFHCKNCLRCLGNVASDKSMEGYFCKKCSNRRETISKKIEALKEKIQFLDLKNQYSKKPNSWYYLGKKDEYQKKINALYLEWEKLENWKGENDD